MLLKHRVIPTLLLKNLGFHKTIKFKNPVYLGDPINITRIFNDKEVDELILLDIDATRKNSGPNFSIIKEIASECFMPLSYGGGITKVKQMNKLFSLGVEKIILNTAAIININLVLEAIKEFGASSIVIAIDVKKSFFGRYQIYSHSEKKTFKYNLMDYIKMINKLGVGELFLNSVDRDGTMSGYDIELLKSITEKVTVPVIAGGGAGSLNDFKLAIKDGGASAVSAGSFFVYTGKHNAVLINYPNYKTLCNLLNNLWS